jgi:hypothetical protein
MASTNAQTASWTSSTGRQTDLKLYSCPAKPSLTWILTHSCRTIHRVLSMYMVLSFSWGRHVEDFAY